MHIDDVFMAVKIETLEKLKDFIKLNFHIQESGKVKKILGCIMNGFILKRAIHQNDHGE